MAQRVADYFPQRLNVYVPNMTFHSDVDETGMYRIDLGAVVDVDADGILDGVSIASAGTILPTAFNTLYSSDKMGPYGRNVTIVASGANTDTITVHGRDYLNQPMSETITFNGTSPVSGKKAFKYIDKFTNNAEAGQTCDVGWGNVFGLPFKSRALVNAIEDNAATGSGTFVAAINTDPQTATTGDPRGTYDPNMTPDGVKTMQLTLIADTTDLHGVEHFFNG